MKILIIANARRKGGLSGSDSIYLAFEKHWPASIRVWQMMDIDYKPFWLCYLHRILLGCFIALIEPQRYDFVYSASDFLMDSLPAFIMKLKGNRWFAGFFLFAPKGKRIYQKTQAVVYRLIKRFADMVIVTNPSMLAPFFPMKMSWINGGIDMKLAGMSDKPKIYDAVFCGRIHETKGIKEMLEAWAIVRERRPDAKLAIIGDGDMGMEYIRSRLWRDQMGITLLGYMGDERFEIYKQSKIVLYPTPIRHSHFSMAPVEAMACGCPMVAFDLPVLKFFDIDGIWKAECIHRFADIIVTLLKNKVLYENQSIRAREWAHQFDYEKQTMRVWRDICEVLK